MIVHEIPTRPWGAYLLEINKQKYLVMVDYYSSFIEINLLQNSTTSKQIFTHCKLQFSRHGISDKLVTDNGSHFSSITFKQFLQHYGLQHQTASPHYPQSNGMAEKAVQTTKNLIKKAILDERDPYLALLEYTVGIPLHIRITCKETHGTKNKDSTTKFLQPKLINPRSVYSKNSVTARQKKNLTVTTTQQL